LELSKNNHLQRKQLYVVCTKRAGFSIRCVVVIITNAPKGPNIPAWHKVFTNEICIWDGKPSIGYAKLHTSYVSDGSQIVVRKSPTHPFYDPFPGKMKIPGKKDGIYCGKEG
jgi:hypothetical protein